MDIRKMIADASNDALAAEEGYVYQVWEDGEITLQKSGPLLWQRNLYCIEMGFPDPVPVDWFPPLYRNGKHGFVFASKEDAYRIRAAIRDWDGEE